MCNTNQASPGKVTISSTVHTRLGPFVCAFYPEPSWSRHCTPASLNLWGHRTAAQRDSTYPIKGTLWLLVRGCWDFYRYVSLSSFMHLTHTVFQSLQTLFHCVFMCLNTVLTSVLKLQRVNISLLHVSCLKCAEFCFLIPPVQWIIWRGCQPIEIKLRLHTITSRIRPRDFPCLPKALLLTSAVNVLLYLLWKRL